MNFKTDMIGLRIGFAPCLYVKNFVGINLVTACIRVRSHPSAF
ncbi:hypothetical protein [Arenicella xantha]|nr:hypothetical protein [Arenicella xantha]